MSNVAVVNVVRILDESKKGKVLAGTLRTAAEKWQKELQDLEKQFNEAREKLQKLGQGISDAHFKQEREVRMLEIEVRHMQAKAQLDIESRRDQARSKVLQEISPIMENLAKELGIDVIITVPAREVAFVSEAADITDKLLAKVDAA